MATKPSAALLREISDETVLRTLAASSRMTRAALAATTGLSKPTVTDSISRLESAGLVSDTGERTSGRGGVGTYYALAESVGVALAVTIAPDGIVAEALDPAGATRARAAMPVERPAAPTAVTRLLGRVVRSAIRNAGAAPVRVAVVSAADPVDRATGDLVHLPDAPFLLGALSPVRTLGPLIHGPVLVDNDINWAARAERDARRTQDDTTADDFVYLHLGEGLGCAVLADGRVLRGHRGIAGEIAHVLTSDAHGRAVPLTAVFEQLGLRRAGSTAIDVDRLLDRFRDPRRAPALTRALGRALSGVIAAATAFCDPALVVLGGPWAGAAGLRDEVATRVAASARPVAVEAARSVAEPSLVAVRAAAVRELRDGLVARTRGSRVPG